MEHISRVNVLHPTEDLVEKELNVVLAEWLNGMNDVVKITLHQV